ncbi:hypothetical protein E2C01_000141 [Portunus trituberculatus]|uniref:Uncharacterized protein n=1 Tax=Portunus trituberculatus TaxID=210409 RepID=A0A5B7CDV3_PORTR|nr:hypothetical protein [Portunus trituberculatus]
MSSGLKEGGMNGKKEENYEESQQVDDEEEEENEEEEEEEEEKVSINQPSTQSEAQAQTQITAPLQDNLRRHGRGLGKVGMEWDGVRASIKPHRQLSESRTAAATAETKPGVDLRYEEAAAWVRTQIVLHFSALRVSLALI